MMVPSTALQEQLVRIVAALYAGLTVSVTRHGRPVATFTPHLEQPPDSPVEAPLTDLRREWGAYLDTVHSRGPYRVTKRGRFVGWLTYPKDAHPVEAASDERS